MFDIIFIIAVRDFLFGSHKSEELFLSKKLRLFVKLLIRTMDLFKLLIIPYYYFIYIKKEGIENNTQVLLTYVRTYFIFSNTPFYRD